MMFGSLLLVLSAIAANKVQAVVERPDAASTARATAEAEGDDRNDPLLFFGGSDQQPYLDWLGTRGNKFENFVFLDSTAATSDKVLSNGAAFHWTMDKENNMLKLGLVARATGWMGFGLSENGGMRGADMMVFDAAHPDRLIDAHFMDDIFTPAIDTCQNWQHLWSQTTDGFLIVEAQRVVDTLDAQDRVIYYDADLTTPPHLIISAWGESPSWEYHGPKNRAKGAVRFFGSGGDVLDQFRKAMEVQADGSFFLGANDFAIPDVDTHYQRFCFHGSDLAALGVPVDEPLHIIGLEPVIDPRSKKFVHHYNLMTTGVHNGTCDESRDHFEVLYGWGPGGLPYEFASTLGSPLGADGFSDYYLDIHYNNPDFEAGFLDSSGVTVYWTRTKRQYDVGVFAMADPRTNGEGEALGEGLTEHTYNCPASCTSLVLPVNQSITILATSFHMHRQGRMATLSVIRDGVEVFSSAVEYFDFDQAGSIYARQKQEDFQLLPGDSMVATCYYDSPEARTFGFSSESEMCIATIQYYPRVEQAGQASLMCGYGSGLAECTADYSQKLLASTGELNRMFGDEIATSDGSGNNRVCLEIDLADLVGPIEVTNASGALGTSGSGSIVLLSTLLMVVAGIGGL